MIAAEHNAASSGNALQEIPIRFALLVLQILEDPRVELADDLNADALIFREYLAGDLLEVRSVEIAVRRIDRGPEHVAGEAFALELYGVVFLVIGDLTRDDETVLDRLLSAEQYLDAVH